MTRARRPRSSEDGLHRIACDIRLGSILLTIFDDVVLTEETMDAAGTASGLTLHPSAPNTRPDADEDER